MNFEAIKAQFISDEDYEAAEDKLLSINSPEVDDFVISLLESEKPYIRSRSTWIIKEKKLQSAVPHLFRNIFKKSNFKSNGTMVHALTVLDCSEHFKELFEIYLYGNYEPKTHANTIINEQELKFTIEELAEVEELWENCKRNPSLCPCFEDAKEYIQNDIDRYKEKLKNKKS